MQFSTDTRRRLEILAASYARLTGETLVAGEDVPGALWGHPAVIVAHAVEEDPIFFFGNQAALDLFEMDLPAFTQLPSRMSAEPMLRAERERLMTRVRETGVIRDYAGVRVSATGRRFMIEQATVWNLIDEAGLRHGQAALFDRWTRLD